MATATPELEGVTAYVTGASQDIGREISLTLADRGARVALAARGDGTYETAELIDAPGRTLAVETDVTEEADVEASIEATVEQWGGLDVVVNNAGIAGPTAPVKEVDVEGFRYTQDVNVTGPFLVVKHAAEQLRASDRGRVINVSSISGKRPLENRTPYVASKMAIIGLTRTLAFELGGDDVTVNAICPGPVKGPRIEDVISNQADQLGVSDEEAKRRVFTDDAAMGRIVDAGDVAEMVAYLASEAGRHVTAQDINVDAGAVWY